MGKWISTVVLILAVVFLPPAILAYVSQDSLPGDTIYPIKRALEDGILFLASISNPTKAFFAIAYSQRRYKEVTGLIAKEDFGATSKSLQELIMQTSLATGDIREVSSVESRRALAAQLSMAIEEYDKGLEESKQTVANNVTSNAHQQPKSPNTPPTPSNNQDANLASQLGQTQKELDTLQVELTKLQNESSSASVSPDIDLDTISMGLDSIDTTGLQNILDSTVNQYGKVLP